MRRPDVDRCTACRVVVFRSISSEPRSEKLAARETAAEFDALFRENILERYSSTLRVTDPLLLLSDLVIAKEQVSVQEYDGIRKLRLEFVGLELTFQKDGLVTDWAAVLGFSHLSLINRSVRAS